MNSHDNIRKPPAIITSIKFIKKIFSFTFFIFFFRSYHFMFSPFLCWIAEWIVVRVAGIKTFMPDDDDDDDNESSIRRACSLSDLSMGKGKAFSFDCCDFTSRSRVDVTCSMLSFLSMSATDIAPAKMLILLILRSRIRQRFTRNCKVTEGAQHNQKSSEAKRLISRKVVDFRHGNEKRFCRNVESSCKFKMLGQDTSERGQ